MPNGGGGGLGQFGDLGRGVLGQFGDLGRGGGSARKKGVVFLKGVDTPMHTMSHGSFISCPSTQNMPFPSSSHGDVIGSDKLRRRLINIYDELVCRRTLSVIS